MEPAVFLRPPQVCKLRIISWNINGVHTKLEKSNVISFLCDYDVICITEVKTQLEVYFQGYVAYRSVSNANAHRGGTVVFVRRRLQQYVVHVDTSFTDQVWMQFTCV